ncbi:MAG: co-chaperone GroES [Cetobacterium sp.]|uniref:co-chaperone GroES n=1 Tax=unclassified Cetobacterium TaxID=2630983 RepID=UPI00163C9DD0|nr:co-chaperone GroES [Cetobacterium sp. 2A]MBC2856510.1 co-chaperone GroES [Cetobacterium sp. 2A]
MNIKPIGDRILVKVAKKEERTASGIIIAGGTESEKQNIGEIVALGKGQNLIEIKIGEKIIYNKFSGTEVKDNGENYLILNFEDVLAVIE